MVIEKLSAEYMPGDNKAMILFKLDKRSKNLVEKHWAVIQELANTLLGKDVQATKLLDDGNVWSNENTARFVTGAETVAILARHGIVTTCAAGEGSSAARRAANLPR
jgi:hypothetical protein